MTDRAFWSCQCLVCELKRREAEAEPADSDPPADERDGSTD